MITGALRLRKMIDRRRIMKKAQSMKWISGMLVIILCVMSAFAMIDYKIAAAEKNTLEDGTYTMQSFLRSATSDQASMGNAGIVQPIQIIVKDGKCTARVECKVLSTKLGSLNFTGYLAQLSYFPNWKTTSGKIEAPENETPVAVNIESYFENTYDRYNDPKTGTDSRVKGKLYPHYMNFPVEEQMQEMWVQVYVPVMEAISKGSGLQYARFQFDWSTLKKVSDEAKVDPEISTEQKDQGTTTAVKKTTTAKKTNTKKSTKLNIKKLENGIYRISGQMLKTDKKTESMANEAINHKIKLTVKNGKYYITLDFKGLNISSNYGYLSKIKYFTNTYKINQYKVPTGSLKNVTVDSYQKDTKGKKVRDSYGSNYPDQVTFPLISKAKNDGYVPLQVFVPIMDAISPGSGTQAVYLKLDLNSVKAVKSSKEFASNDKNTGKSGNTITTNSSNTSLAGSHEKVTIQSSKLPETTESTNSQLTESNVQGWPVMEEGNLNAEQVSTSTGSGSQTVQEEEEETPIVIPSIMSMLLSVAGVFYKVKSRGL